MKPVFKCEYCEFTGTDEQVNAHEATCIYNYNKKSCWTCRNRGFLNLKQLKCNAGKEVPENMIFENCEKYERKEKSESHMPLTDVFGSFFGL